MSSQELRSVVAIVFIVGLATASFYWGMRVERGRFTPEPVYITDRPPSVVTERSENAPKALPAEPKPAAKTATTAPTAAPKPTVQAPSVPTTPRPAAKESLPVMAMPVTGSILTRSEWMYSPAFGDWRYHSGIDIAADAGTPVKAALAGKIVEVKKDDTLGVQVVIDHGNGLVALYAGLEGVAVASGDQVSKSQVIGRIGEPGILKAHKGTHLHFEVKRNGVPEPPERYLPDIKH